MKKPLKYFVLAALLVLLIYSSCKKEETVIIHSIDEVRNPDQIPLTAGFNHQGENGTESTMSFSVWMFKNDHIADWLGETTDGKNILEPINVIWIDYSSGSLEQAKDKINSFLKACSFKTRSGSSTGYFTFMGSASKLVKTSQYPSDETWSDGSALKDNNHGRVFTRKSTSGNAYYTLGAFSRETGITHHFISFNAARDKMKASENWLREDFITSLPNVLPELNSASYSTKDHDGTFLFVFYQ